jgi:hypothetical protein
VTLRRRFAAAVVAVAASAALVAGIQAAAPRAVAPEPAVGLRAFDGCADLVDYLRPHALVTANEYTARWSEPAPDRAEALASSYLPDPLFVTDPDAPGFAAPAPGVEAPDIAKLDGDRLVMIDGSTLRVIDASGPRPVPRGALDVPDVAASGLLVLAAHRVLVFGRAAAPRSMPGSMPGMEETDAMLVLVDAADAARPVVLRRERITGTVASAGRRDGVVRVVIAGRPAHLLYRPPDNEPRDLGRRRAAAIARRAGAQDLLPRREVSDGTGKVLSSGPLMDCADVRAPARYAGLGVVSILTIDVGDGIDAFDRGHAFGVVANRDVVHSTADRIFVATTRHQASDIDIDVDATTEIHAFDLGGGYLASGSVPGDIRGRYALSGQGDHLRVFTESTQNPADGRTENNAVVLAADTLAPVGSLGRLWPDEQLRDVRWFADRAVAVTEGQDPHSLHLVDLSQPTSPRAAPPPDVRHFSGDIVVVGENRFVGTGADAAPKVGGRGIEISALDLAGGSTRIPLGRGSTFNRELPLTYLPDHRLVIVGGDVPRGGAYLTTAIGVTVDEAGRLTRIGERVGPDPLVRVLSIGDRLVAVTPTAVLFLDPRDLHALTSVDLVGAH